MRIDYGLKLEQTQKLLMTPELRQAITILQMSSLELLSYVEQALLTNPVLELKDEQWEREEPCEEDDSEKFDLNWQEYFHDCSDLGYTPRKDKNWEEDFSFENHLAKLPTLQEHLMFQLRISARTERELKIGEYLIGNIDEHGYLCGETGEMAAALKVEPAELRKVLSLVQTFDPPGVGARDLPECLLLQVRHLGIKDVTVETLIKHHLEDVGKGKLQKIATVLGISPQEVQKAVDTIKTLDPKPGRKFSSSDDNAYVVPDVVVERVGGEYIVLVNDVTVPRLSINPYYKSALSNAGENPDETRKFIESKLNAAVWLIKNIEQRRLTLYKVVDCIVRLQRQFLDHGIRHLKPMTMRQVADLVGVHESTVSRAVMNKYIQTPQGVFALKHLFTSGVEDTSGVKTSSESVKRAIRDIIAGENPARPYSDQKIAEIFKDRGINVSRRTVTKYREELGIASSSQRRRYD